MRADISGGRGGWVLTSNQIHYLASHASAASGSRVNCKVSGYCEIWEPRAAAGIRAIHRMQICAGAFLEGRRLSPRVSKAYSLYHFDSRFFPLRCNALTSTRVNSTDSNQSIRKNNARSTLQILIYYYNRYDFASCCNNLRTTNRRSDIKINFYSKSLWYH